MSTRTMSARTRDRIAGAALLAVALLWIILVYQTIESGEGAAAGPRAFPFLFGAALAVLSLIMLLQTFLESKAIEDETDAGEAAPNEASSVVATIGALVAYGLLLEPLGFVISTAIVVAAIMIFLLRVRAPLQIAGVSLGLALGCYLAFGKLLGTYLPPGTLFPIYF